MALDPGKEPGPSEFTWGRGRMAPLDLADPSNLDELHALKRLKAEEAAEVISYDSEIREPNG